MKKMKTKVQPARNILTILGEEEEKMPFHWDGMPEYNNVEKKPYKTIKVHFRNEDDYKEFCSKMDQYMSEKTVSIWYPELQINQKRFAFYIDEEDVDIADQFTIDNFEGD